MSFVKAASIVTVLGCALAANAGFTPNMFEIPNDPSTWGFATPIASLNGTGGGFTYPVNSGFEASFAGFSLDKTLVSTDVYQLTANASFTTNNISINLNAGDLVFAYRLRLVGTFPGLTVTSLNEAQVIGAPDFGFGQDAMAASLINGQGFVVPVGHDNAPSAGNVDDAAEFGSSVDFEWPSVDTDHLDNAQSITMLLFTGPASIGRGVLNMSTPPGQPGGLVGFVQGADAPEVLIPIIPSPGAAVLGVLGLTTISLRSRRRA